jgi:peroxiredoxin (alkyl hydroperoxide reductase subunit C)
MITVGDVFPEFELTGVDKDNNFVDIDDNGLLGSWSVLYFYPKDFTFICPTEIQGFDALVGNDVDVLGFSPDNEFCKIAWKEDNELIRDIEHTLVADCSNQLAMEVGIVSNEWVPYRATFILDEDNVIQSLAVNALDTGRNHYEVERTLEALRAGGLTGCNWHNGEDFVA